MAEEVAHDPHIKVMKDENNVYFVIDGQEHKLSPLLAREAGEALFKTGSGVFKPA